MWYVIRIQSQAWTRLERELTERSIGHYLPRERFAGTKRGKAVTVAKPLLPSYMFVEVDYPRQSFHDIVALHGVTRFLGQQSPREIPTDFVEGMRRAEKLGVFNHAPTIGHAFTSGEKVKIIEGPYADTFAKVLRAKTKAKRVRLLVQFLGRMVEMDIPADKLQLVEADKLEAA